MRSATPKVLHPLCGRPMLLHVLDALERSRSNASWSSSGTAPSTSPRRCRSSSTGDVPVEFVEQHVQRGTGDAVSVALTAFADDLDARGRPHRGGRRRPARCGPRRSPGWPPSTAGPTPRPSLLTARVADPTGYGRIVRDEQGRVDRIVEQADADRRRARDRRGEPVDLLLPPRPARARAAPAQPRERAGRVLPHRRRSRCCARPGTRRRSASRPTIPPRRSASTTAPSSPTAEAELRARINAAGCATGVTHGRPRPHLRRHHRRARARRPAAPGHDPRGPHRRRRPARSIGPDTQLVDTVVGRATRSSARPSPASRRSATAPPSARTCRCGRAPASPPARTSARSSR